MKKYKYLIYLVSLLVISSCIVEEPEEVTPGEALAILYAPANAAFLFETTTEINIDLTFSENTGASITQVNVTKKLVTANGESAPLLFTISGSTITQSETELFADVPVNGVVLTENDLDPGDKWVFSYTFIITDGRELVSGDQTKVTFTCVSDIGGEYTSVGAGSGGGGWDVIPEVAGCTFCWNGTSTVTLTDKGGGIYEISDATAGLAPLFWGGDPEVTQLVDICGGLSIAPYTDQWADTNTTTVTLNADGTISLSYSNTYGDNLTAILTPTP